MDLAGYTELFTVLLVAYLAYAVWARLDPRYPFAGAAVLVLGGAYVSSSGDPGTGEVLGIFGFLTLLAGVAGAILAGARRPATDEAPAAPTPEPVDHR